MSILTKVLPYSFLVKESQDNPIDGRDRESTPVK